MASNLFALNPENKKDALGRLSCCWSLHVNFVRTTKQWRNETHTIVDVDRYFLFEMQSPSDIGHTTSCTSRL